MKTNRWLIVPVFLMAALLLWSCASIRQRKAGSARAVSQDPSRLGRHSLHIPAGFHRG